MPPRSGRGGKPHGWQVHDRPRREVPTAPRPDLTLTWTDTGAAASLCTQAHRMAVEERTSPGGASADFLHGDAAEAARLDTAP